MIRARYRRGAILAAVTIVVVVSTVLAVTLSPERAAADHNPTSVSLVRGANNITYSGPTAPVEDALGAIANRVTAVWFFENASQRWLLWSGQLPPSLRGFAEMERGLSYFVIVDANLTWQFPLAPPGAAPESVDLRFGANSVTYDGPTLAVEAALNVIAVRVTAVWFFENASQRWLLWSPQLPPSLRGFGEIVHGLPYFLLVDSNVTWRFISPDVLPPDNEPAQPQLAGSGLLPLGVTFVERVSDVNEFLLEADVVSAAALPAIQNGVWTDVVGLTEALNAQLVLASEQQAFAEAVAQFVEPTDAVYEFTWQKSDGTNISTLGVTDAEGVLKFEPLSYLAGAGSAVDPDVIAAGLDGDLGVAQAGPLQSRALAAGGAQLNLLGQEGVRWAFGLTLQTSDVTSGMVGSAVINDQTEQIVFIRQPLWDARATKEVSTFTVQRTDFFTVSCTTVNVTVIWASGFKRFSEPEFAPDGFSPAPLTVSGRFGDDGVITFSRTLCADGQTL